MGKSENFKECIKYFKSNPGFKRMFEGFREKYASLGRIGGSVTLKNPSDQEIWALRGFLQRDFFGADTVTVTYTQFQKSLTTTKFKDYSLLEILEGYFNEELIIKREVHEAFENERNDFFCEVMAGMGRDIGRQWMEHVLMSKEKPYTLIMQSYKKDRDELAKRLNYVVAAIDRTADHVERGVSHRLPVFAASLTGNPHYFDEGSESDRMLVAGLCFLLQCKEPSNAEEKAELLYRGGIIKDDISNFTVTYGIVIERGGSLGSSGASFAKAGEPMHLSLANISRAKHIYPYDTSCGSVYAVENPAVFSALIDNLKIKTDEYALRESVSNEAQSLQEAGGTENQVAGVPALICISGQPKLASLVLMDKLAQRGKTIYYAGDFDPEGLAIADRLKKRYGDNLILWKYTTDDYFAAISRETISPDRIKKLEKLESPELCDIALIMRGTQCAGYQERIIELYKEDIHKSI